MGIRSMMTAHSQTAYRASIFKAVSSFCPEGFLTYYVLMWETQRGWAAQGASFGAPAGFLIQ